MEQYGEVGIPDFLKLMNRFLDGELNAQSYYGRYFDLTVKRKKIGEAEKKILGLAFHDADDYDADLKLDHTITERELRAKVAASFESLVLLGHRPEI